MFKQIALLLVATLPLCDMGLAQADGAALVEQVKAVVGKVQDGDETTRIHAANLVRRIRTTITGKLLEQLDKGKRDYSFNGTTHTAMQLLGEAGGPIAVPKLMEMITFELSSERIACSGEISAINFYPAAEALASIGGPQVLNAALQKIKKTDDDKTIRLCAWVVSRQFTGGRTPVAFLQAYIDNIVDEKPKKRLEIALECIAKRSYVEAPEEYRKKCEEMKRLLEQKRREAKEDGGNPVKP